MNNTNIEKTLVLSTAHISKHTNDVLNACKPADLDNENEFDKLPFRFIERHHYGYIIFLNQYIKGDNDAKNELNKVPELHLIIDHALALGCTMVNLDRDADEISALPTFQW